MPVRRKDRLAIEILKRFRPLAAAQQHELVAGIMLDKRPRQLDRHRQHPHPLGPPTGGQIDGEPAHHMNVEERKSQVRAPCLTGVTWDSAFESPSLLSEGPLPPGGGPSPL